MMKKIRKQQLKTTNKSEILKQNASKMSKKMTAPEKKFLSLMKELNENVECQKIVGSKIYDFYIPKKNMLIEVDGDYYHGSAIFEEKGLNSMQKRNKKNDVFKNTLAIGMGYSLERVWESDLNNNYQIVKERMIELLK